MIQVGQTLHGYEDGHSLLASSQALPYGAESTLLVLSDLSGQSFVSGFDAYLTGYPLTGGNAYAFAKTWYAPEMERPGCVWTHTLLIKFGDLARLQSLHPLKKLFIRPSRKRSSWGEYEHVLRLDEEDTVFDASFPPDVKARVASICDALYADDSQAVIVPTSEGSLFEDPFISIWGQQWPRLRRNFTFCTGAIEGRELDGRAFDLQCIPSSFAGIGIAPPYGSVIIDSRSSIGRLPEAVLGTILTDLQSSDPRLRAFMRNYGADAPPERTSFSALISIWLTINDGFSIDKKLRDLVLQISKEFPIPSSVAKLKRDILTSPSVEGESVALPIEDRFLMVTELSSESMEIVDAFSLEGYVDQLIELSPSTVVRTAEKLIRYRNLNEFGQRVIVKIATSLEWDVVEANASPELLMVLLGTNPRLLSNPGVWRRLQGRAHEIVDIFSSRVTNREEWVNLCQATIQNGVAQAAGILFARAPFSLVPEVLNYFQTVDQFEDTFQSW